MTAANHATPPAPPRTNHTPVVRKAIVVHPPWATLIALGIKTIETRPGPPNGSMRPAGIRGLPGLPIKPGERIAIVAGASKPKFGARIGVYVVDEWVSSGLPCTWVDDSLLDLPLGAVVCTVTVADVAPIVDWDRGWSHDDDTPMSPFIEVGPFRDDLTLLPAIQHPVLDDVDLGDQLPLGDFTHGRWGWLLTDPEQVGPVPCKGRQGVFALPDAVAERVNA